MNNSTLYQATNVRPKDDADQEQNRNHVANTWSARRNTGGKAEDTRRQVTEQAPIWATHRNSREALIDPFPIRLLRGNTQMAISFGAEATRCMHAMSTTVQVMLDPRPNLSISQHIVTISYSQLPVACVLSCRLV